MDAPETQGVGWISSSPDAHGWQARYEIGRQDRELVVTKVTVHSPTGRMPSGGLTAEGARSLVKLGTALAEFTKAVRGRTAVRATTERDAEELLAAQTEGQTWRSVARSEFLDREYRREMPVVDFGPAANRRVRIAQTAALYVQAMHAGDPAPRKTVAAQHARAEAAVRDDLHAARHETPPLLTELRGKGRAGGELTAAALELLKVYAHAGAASGTGAAHNPMVRVENAQEGTR
jgi:hypothetical protein